MKGIDEIMFSHFEDIPGDCNAHCYIADNNGDGNATMRCSLEKNHDGWHKEEFRNSYSSG